jgi:hypothetical protein
MRASSLLLWSALALASCAPEVPVRLSIPEPLPGPGAAGSGEPRLAVAPSGDVLMTWFEPAEGGRHALRFARLAGDAWSVPVTIAAGDSFFVNWADFPALVALDDAHLAVSYPWRSGEDPYAYDVWIRRSADGGATWGAPVRPHTDGTTTEHGFVTLLAEAGELRAVWLDGRNFAGAGGHDDHDAGPGPEMTLRTAVIGAGGTLRDEALLDPRACDCCATAGAVTAGGTVIAYRDRSAEEIRDISLVRLANGAWSEPAPLHVDGWEIPGCPVNGPALAAAGNRAAIAWYTQARDTAAVYVAFARDGAAFSAPIRIDGGDPLGRTGIALLDDGSAVVSWLEMAADTAEVRLRRVRPDGRADEPLVLARTSARRSSGFPQVVRSGARLVCAWTEPGAASQVHVAAVPLGRK